MQVSRVQHIFWHMCTSQTCTSIVVPSFWGILKFFLTYLILTDPWLPSPNRGLRSLTPLPSEKIWPRTASTEMNSKPTKRNDRYGTPMPIFSVLRENPIYISFEQTQLFRPLFRFQQILSFLNFLLFFRSKFSFSMSRQSNIVFVVILCPKTKLKTKTLKIYKFWVNDCFENFFLKWSNN